MGVLLLFVDGVGLGAGNPDANPLLTANLPTWRRLLNSAPLAAAVAEPRPGGEGAWVRACDANLGVAGLPQSATGQTAIFTGENASQAIGRHLNAYPSPNLRRILGRSSVFKQVLAQGRTASFLNAYGPMWFATEAQVRLSLAQELALPEDEVARLEVQAQAEMAREEEERANQRTRSAQSGESSTLSEKMQARERRRQARYRPSASTVAVLAAGLPLRSFADLAAGRAVFHDITHWTMPEHGLEMAPVEPEEAGRRAAVLAREFDFAMHEHFMTDFAGHSQDPDLAARVLQTYDRFVSGVLAHFDPQRDLLLIVSDHGNIEDLSVRTHTRNPVAFIAYGRGAEAACRRTPDLTGVTPAIVGALT